MTNKTAILKLLKNLIENKEFEQAFALKENFSWLNRPIYKALKYYNFGNALFYIENALFQQLEDEKFIPIEEVDTGFEENYVDDYDDFRESGGNIDEIESWTRE